MAAILILSLLALAAAHPNFEQWTATFGKHYHEHEIASRKAKYEANVQRIDELNSNAQLVPIATIKP